MNSEKTIRTFAGAVAIVTGGASGIGRALCEELAKRGSEVVIADRQTGPAEEIAARIQFSGGKATTAALDVTHYPSMEQLVQDTVRRSGRIDYLFNNAGIGIGGHVHHYTIDDWNYIVNVNLNGVINGVQAAYNVMVAQGFGHIVNTASTAGLMPFAGGVAYSTTKHAVVGLSRSLRAEAARFGIRVSALCPGVIDTAIWKEGGKFGRMLMDIPADSARRMVDSLKPIPPEMLAKKTLDAVAANRAFIVEPAWWKRIWWINRLFPSLAIDLAQKRFQKDIESIGTK